MNWIDILLPATVGLCVINTLLIIRYTGKLERRITSLEEKIEERIDKK